MTVARPSARRPRDPLAEIRGVRETAPAGEVRLVVGPGRLGTAARLLHRAGARFVTLLAGEGPPSALVGVFALRGELVSVRTPLDDAGAVRASGIGDWWPAARWAERELAERHGVAASDGALTRPDPDRVGARVHGPGVLAIPYGPIRSGVFESIQFLIETAGEDVLRIDTRPFFKHRGLERRFAGLRPADAVVVAERIAGIASVAHATAFCEAVERALGVEPPARAQRWRAVLAEIERVANHLDVIAKQAETTALLVGQARFGILKEQMLRLQARLTGSRFGRGMLVPGGVRPPLPQDPSALLAELDLIEDDLRRDRRLFLRTSSMTDRLIGSGRIPRELVEEYGAVGPLARGSGLSLDARHERPYGHYRRLGLQVATARDGDAMARVEVRFEEISESLRIVRQALDQLQRRDGPLAADLPGGAGEAFGWAEAPQGEVVYRVVLEAGAVAEVQIASPSLRNWALFSEAFPADVLTDFAFIEHSFGLTPAGADR